MKIIKCLFISKVFIALFLFFNPSFSKEINIPNTIEFKLLNSEYNKYLRRAMRAYTDGEIYGDKNLFIQALLNITQNAIHAIDVGKDAFIEISTGVTFRQPINGKIFSTLATIKIADNGPIAVDQ